MPNIDDAPVSYHQWRRRQELEERYARVERQQEELATLREQARRAISEPSPLAQYVLGDMHIGGSISTRTISMADIDRMYERYMPPKRPLNVRIAEQRATIKSIEANLLKAKERLFDLQKEIDED